jgi:hypothetical protein
MKTMTNCARVLVAAAMFPICSLALGQEATTSGSFNIKEEGPRTGTNLKRNQVWGGSLPYDKTYAELTPEQRGMLKGSYLQMGESDEPPFPVDGLGPLYKAIGKAADAAGGVLGKLEFDVLVDATGTVTKVEIVRSPDPRLSRYAGHIAMLTKFKPAMCGGKPCQMGFPVSISFVRN